MTEVYSPFHATLEESSEAVRDFGRQVEAMDVSDETLILYVRLLLEAYVDTIQGHFPDLVSSLFLCGARPFRSIVLRLGPNGVCLAHYPSPGPSVRVVRPKDFDPPLDSQNMFVLSKRLDAPDFTFDFRIRSYSPVEARREGMARALRDALSWYWQVVDVIGFEKICRELLAREGVELRPAEPAAEDRRWDAAGQVVLREPAGYRRVEAWAFEFKHHTQSRVSTEYIREAAQDLSQKSQQCEILCILTSGDLTSVANHVAVRDLRIRVWDRQVLNRLVNEHLDAISPFFGDYAKAAAELRSGGQPESRRAEFESRLATCPPGVQHFRAYELICADIWKYLFPQTLGRPKLQQATHDGVQRRDCVFPIRDRSGFWGLVSLRFSANFVILDAKNYSAPVDKTVIDDAAKYANESVGRFVVVTCRHGAEAGAANAQRRLLTGPMPVAVLVLSDEQQLEMVGRKEAGEQPEDLVQDLLETLLLSV